MWVWVEQFNAYISDEFQAFKYLKFTDTNEDFSQSCFEMAEPTDYMRTGKI